MTERKSVEFATRIELTEALRRFKAVGGDLSQVLIFTATSPPRLEMAADVYAELLAAQSEADDAAPVKKATRKRKSTKTTRGA